MTKRYRLHLLLASLVTLLPIPAAFLLELPAGLGAHLRSFAWASLSMLLGLLLCVWITFRDPGNKGRNRKPLTLVLWIIPVLSNLCFWLTYALTMGYEINAAFWFMIPMGLLFSAIGNYLPKCRMNSTLGIKVSWAYTSEENWNATHRLAGKLWFWGGILSVLLAFLPLQVGIPLIIAVFLGMTLIPMGYSYRYCKMQKARGDELLPAAPPLFGKKNGKYSLIFLAALLLFVGVLMLTGDIQYVFEEDHLSIQADFYSDDVLNYDDIDGMEYREGNVDGYRASGFGSSRLLMGFFQNDEFGNYVRYTYAKPEACIVLTLGDRTLVLSAETAAQTQALYEGLLEKTR